MQVAEAEGLTPCPPPAPAPPTRPTRVSRGSHGLPTLPHWQARAPLSGSPRRRAQGTRGTAARASPPPRWAMKLATVCVLVMVVSPAPTSRPAKKALTVWTVNVKGKKKGRGEGAGAREAQEKFAFANYPFGIDCSLGHSFLSLQVCRAQLITEPRRNLYPLQSLRGKDVTPWTATRAPEVGGRP